MVSRSNLGRMSFLISLVVLISGIVSLGISTQLIETRSESDSYWTVNSQVPVQIEVSSESPRVEFTISQVKLDVPHFNVSGGEVRIEASVIQGSLLANRSLSIGDVHPGVESEANLSDELSERETFVICVIRQGEDATVDFFYKTYRIMSWESTPYPVLLPGYYEALNLGAVLFVSGAVMLFLSYLAQKTFLQQKSTSQMT